MNYVALLRGVNVGGKRPVAMATLKNVAISLGYAQVETYLNSGNLLFSSVATVDKVHTQLAQGMLKTFGFSVDPLILTHTQVQAIEAAIPNVWENNEEYKCDVAYLFPAIDSPDILKEIAIRPSYVAMHYVPGALYWRVRRADYAKSNLISLTTSPLYAKLTIRNINTARKLASMQFQMDHQ